MTKTFIPSKVTAVVVITVMVIAATAEHAIRTDSPNPIWMIGWLPAVLVALYRPGTGKRWAARILRNSRA